MKGVILLSHGNMAQGVLDTIKMFLGQEVSQIDFVSLRSGENLDEFSDELSNKIKSVDSGEGVVMFADIIGGTPANQAVRLIACDKKLDLLVGMNLPMILEYLMSRENSFDPKKIIEAGGQGILDLRSSLGL